MIYSSVIVTMMAVKAEQEAFDLKCSLLPEEEATKLKAERKKELEAKLDHHRKLEIANAGRARNFWGS